jgi:hypothetical protein
VMSDAGANGAIDDTDVDSLGIKALKELVAAAGLSTADCLDKDDLRARAREALAKNKQSAATSEAASGAEPSGAQGGRGAALPPGWTSEKREAKACKYTLYMGPGGQPRARTIKEAWRLHTASTAAADTPADADADAEAAADGGGSNVGETAAPAAAPAKLPKMPKSAFMFYSQAQRAAVTAAHPDLKAAEVNKRLREDVRARHRFRPTRTGTRPRVRGGRCNGAAAHAAWLRMSARVVTRTTTTRTTLARARVRAVAVEGSRGTRARRVRVVGGPRPYALRE